MIIILVVLVLLLILSIPAYPYNRSWGVAPVGLIVTVLLVLLALRLLGYV